ncbi:LAFE_0C05050g1_1 [Lachancea fermentati]|uniref:LAFE_0C05050g1_1 n=1 Tax=Lachancea fermentati TaxID=4955 RepID=A0A1G4M9F5_LACFM|nr:LAFE_0C05050g1_1 [Lachancea fermentati]
MNDDSYSYNTPPPLQPLNVPQPTSSGQLLNGNEHCVGHRPTGYQQPQSQLQAQSQTYYYAQHQYMPVNQGYIPAYYSPYHMYGYQYQQHQQQSQPQPYGTLWNGNGPSIDGTTSKSLQSSATNNRMEYDVAGLKTRASSYDRTDQRDKDYENKEDNVSEAKELDSMSNTKDTVKESVVPIPGTSITLQTEEDIKNWREERRKMWLLKISNQKDKHRANLGVADDEMSNRGVFLEGKREKQFIQSIQNQITRFNPNQNLNLKILQRSMASENGKLLSFIKELGDAGLLEYELTEQEKERLFGGNMRVKRGSGENQNKKNIIL